MKGKKVNIQAQAPPLRNTGRGKGQTNTPPKAAEKSQTNKAKVVSNKGKY